MDWNRGVELATAIAWPTTVLIIFFYLRLEVAAAIGRIRSARLPGGTELSFGEAEVDRHRPSPKPIPISSGALDITKVGNVYWLGSDLMWTIDVILRGGPGSLIVHGLSQAIHHVTELGSISSAEGQKLGGLLNQAKQRLETEWSREARDEIALELKLIAYAMGGQLEATQPGFRSDAKH